MCALLLFLKLLLRVIGTENHYWEFLFDSSLQKKKIRYNKCYFKNTSKIALKAFLSLASGVLMNYNHRDARLVKIGRKSYNHRKRTLSTTWRIPEKAAVMTAGLTSGKAETRAELWWRLEWVGWPITRETLESTNCHPGPKDARARRIGDLKCKINRTRIWEKMLKWLWLTTCWSSQLEWPWRNTVTVV